MDTQNNILLAALGLSFLATSFSILTLARVRSIYDRLKTEANKRVKLEDWKRSVEDSLAAQRGLLNYVHEWEFASGHTFPHSFEKTREILDDPNTTYIKRFELLRSAVAHDACASRPQDRLPSELKSMIETDVAESFEEFVLLGNLTVEEVSCAQRAFDALYAMGWMHPQFLEYYNRLGSLLYETAMVKMREIVDTPCDKVSELRSLLAHCNEVGSLSRKISAELNHECRRSRHSNHVPAHA